MSDFFADWQPTSETPNSQKASEHGGSTGESGGGNDGNDHPGLKRGDTFHRTKDLEERLKQTNSLQLPDVLEKDFFSATISPVMEPHKEEKKKEPTNFDFFASFDAQTEMTAPSQPELKKSSNEFDSVDLMEESTKVEGPQEPIKPVFNENEPQSLLEREKFPVSLLKGVSKNELTENVFEKSESNARFEKLDNPFLKMGTEQTADKSGSKETSDSFDFNNLETTEKSEEVMYNPPRLSLAISTTNIVVDPREGHVHTEDNDEEEVTEKSTKTNSFSSFSFDMSKEERQWANKSVYIDPFDYSSDLNRADPSLNDFEAVSDFEELKSTESKEKEINASFGSDPFGSDPFGSSAPFGNDSFGNFSGGSVPSFGSSNDAFGSDSFGSNNNADGFGDFGEFQSSAEPTTFSSAPPEQTSFTNPSFGTSSQPVFTPPPIPKRDQPFFEMTTEALEEFVTNVVRLPTLDGDSVQLTPMYDLARKYLHTDNPKLCVKCDSQIYRPYSTLCFFCGTYYMEIEFNHIRRIISTPKTKQKLGEILQVESPHDEEAQGTPKPDQANLEALTPAQQKAARRLLLWQQNKTLLQENQFFPKFNPLKQMIRDGIPPSIRIKMWMALTGAQVKKSKDPSHYNFLNLSNMNKKSPYIEQINSDVERTSTLNSAFAEKKEELRRLLLAYSWHDPKIGTVMGLGIIFASLLTVMDEESVFWLFVSMCDELLPHNFFKELEVEQKVFSSLMSKKLPELYAHLQKINVNIGVLTCQWFGQLFLNCMPTEHVFRVWDVFFNEGNKVLYRIGLGLFKMMEKLLLALHDPTQIYVILKDFPMNLDDVDELFEISFNQLGSFPRARIDALRASFVTKS